MKKSFSAILALSLVMGTTVFPSLALASSPSAPSAFASGFGFVVSLLLSVLFFVFLVWIVSLSFRRTGGSIGSDSHFSETLTTVTEETEDVPDFDNRKAKNLFLAVNSAWDKADKDALRVLLSGDLAEEFADNLDTFESDGKRDRVTDIILDGIEYLGSNVRGWIVRHAFNVKYSAKFYVVDRAGAVVEGDKLEPVSVKEKWFVAESDNSFGYELVGIER